MERKTFDLGPNIFVSVTIIFSPCYDGTFADAVIAVFGIYGHQSRNSGKGDIIQQHIDTQSV